MRSNGQVLGLILSEEMCANKKKIVLFSFKVVSLDCNVIFMSFYKFRKTVIKDM